MPRPATFERDEVVERAMDVFWRQGYEATGVDDLLAQLGLARASLYRTFGSKSALYAEALDHYRRVEGDLFRACLTEATTAVDALRRLFGLIVEQTGDSARPAGCFVVTAACELAGSDADIAARVDDELVRLESDLCSLLERGVANGELEPELECRRWARTIAGAVQGLRVLSIARDDPAAVSDAAAGSLEAILLAIVGRNGAD